jgi:hypothetical protein
MKFRVFWDVAPCSHVEVALIALIMEAVHASEKSVNFNVTIRRYIPEDSKFHTHRRENLKSLQDVTFNIQLSLRQHL